MAVKRTTAEGKPDVITQRELEHFLGINELHTNSMRLLWTRLANGASVEPGKLKAIQGGTDFEDHISTRDLFAPFHVTPGMIGPRNRKPTPLCKPSKATLAKTRAFLERMAMRKPEGLDRLFLQLCAGNPKMLRGLIRDGKVAWRRRWKVPRYKEILQEDLQILLDLESSAQELRRRIRQALRDGAKMEPGPLTLAPE
jgi:hypothetical protein